MKKTPTRPDATPKRTGTRKAGSKNDVDLEDELTPAQMRELERRVRDANDTTRYLLVSVLGPRFVLYYDVASDSYLWNEARRATLFKRRKAALAIKRLLPDGVRIVPCKVDRRGEVVRSSITLPARRTHSTRARKRAT